MLDPTIVTAASAGTLALGIASAATLRGWNGWLELKRLELAGKTPQDDPVPPSATARIELADLKERVRKLEAIASGVDY